MRVCAFYTFYPGAGSHFLLNKLDLFANLLNLFFLAPVELSLLGVEEVVAVRVNRDNQGTEVFDLAYPERFRHPQISPLGVNNFFHVLGSVDGVSGWVN